MARGRKTPTPKKHARMVPRVPNGFKTDAFSFCRSAGLGRLKRNQRNVPTNLECSHPEKSSSSFNSYASRRSCESIELELALQFGSCLEHDVRSSRCSAPLGVCFAAPPRYEKHFIALEPAIKRASDSSLRLSSKMNNMTSAVWLCLRAEQQRNDLDPLASGRSGNSRTTMDRQRAETQKKPLRSKWVETLGSLLKGTDTPMGALLDKSADNLELLGRGRRASTLRERGRTVRKFLACQDTSE